MASFSTTKPVFVRQKDIPNAANVRPTVLEICLAAERAAGQGTILGAQEIRGLWRVYPATEAARTDILLKGMRVRDTVIQASNTNPYTIRGESEEEKLTTKVWVDKIPMSVADSEIEHSLIKVGCELRSDIKHERARDPDNKLTRFLTGKRFVFISVPPTPLEQQLKVSIFTAKIYHKEQKQAKKVVTCSRCLEPDHHVSQCPNEIVCRQCKKPGHKRGDIVCQFSDTVTDKHSTNRHQTDRQGAHSDIESADRPATRTNASSGGSSAVATSSAAACSSAEDGASASSTKAARGDGEGGDRGRSSSRQSLLSFNSHRRSSTPKRQRSNERYSPRERTAGKCSRRDDHQSGSPVHVTLAETPDDQQ